MYVSTPEDLNVKMEPSFDRTGGLGVTQEDNFIVQGNQKTVKHVHPAVRVFELGGHFLYITESGDERRYQCRDCHLFKAIPADQPSEVLAAFEQWICGYSFERPCKVNPHHQKL